MPSSQAEITLFHSIIYNRKDGDYTLSRIPPNQREIKTLRGNRKINYRILSVSLSGKPKEGQTETTLQSTFIEEPGAHPRGKGLYFILLSSFRAAPFFLFYCTFLLKILFKGNDLWLKIIKPVESSDYHPNLGCYIYLLLSIIF